MSLLLSTHGVGVDFGGVRALGEVSIEVPQGGIVGLVGPNGSGKSTLFNVVSGFLAPTRGEVRFKGRTIGGMPPDEIARMGLCRTFQLQPPMPALTVAEGVLAAFPAQAGETVFGALWRRALIGRQEVALRERARRILEQFQIDHAADLFGSELSGGQQKLAAIARAVASGAELILLDEPAAGVNPVLRDRIAQWIVELKRSMNLTVLLVEHDMRFVGATCDDVYVLDAGSLIAHGPYDLIRRDPRVLEAYLGHGGPLR